MNFFCFDGDANHTHKSSYRLPTYDGMKFNFKASEMGRNQEPSMNVRQKSLGRNVCKHVSLEWWGDMKSLM